MSTNNICLFSFLGGLGNQMFEYAFYLTLKNRYPNHTFYIDINGYDKLNPHNGFEIFSVFDITEKNFFSPNLFTYPVKTILLKLPVRIAKRLPGINYIVDNYISFNTMNLRLTAGINIVNGVFASEAYFQEHASSIRNIYKFPGSRLNNQTLKMLDMILAKDSVSLHVRLGDYVSNPKAKVRMEGICDKDYYARAINFFVERYSNLTFFVFSDEPDTAQQILPSGHNYVWVRGNNAHSSWQDMFLMSQCKSNIIANSSFSWWAAYLNRSDTKIVFRPKRFAKESICLDIFPKEWIS